LGIRDVSRGVNLEIAIRTGGAGRSRCQRCRVTGLRGPWVSIRRKPYRGNPTRWTMRCTWRSPRPPLAVGSSPSRPSRTVRRSREPRLPAIPCLRVLFACTALGFSGETGTDHCLAAPLGHAHHPPGITGVPLSTCLRASTPAATDHSAGLRPRVPARAARDAFRPRGFAPPRRFAPRTTPERVRCGSGFGPDKVAGVLQPATDWGSPRFDDGGLGPTDIAARRRDHTTASSRRVHTPRRFPRQQPDGVTTAVAPVTFHRSCGPRRTRTALARR